jgi:hypothetical protein
LQVSRNYVPIEQLYPSDATVLLLGTNIFELNDARLLDNLERLAKNGNRIVIEPIESAFDGKTKAKILDKRWGVLHEAERRFGRGSIIITKQPLTNEVLAKNASARAAVPLLIGPNKTVIFEETHLGVTESGSVLGLIRRYHLMGLFAGLLLVTTLAIWNRSVSFPPPPRYEVEAQTGIVAGDTRATLAGLLSRHIASGSLVDLCVNEWNRTRPDRPVRNVASSNAVEAYARIQAQLEDKKVANL